MNVRGLQPYQLPPRGEEGAMGLWTANFTLWVMQNAVFFLFKKTQGKVRRNFFPGNRKTDRLFLRTNFQGTGPDLPPGYGGNVPHNGLSPYLTNTRNPGCPCPAVHRAF